MLQQVWLHPHPCLNPVYVLRCYRLERITKLELLGYEARHCKFALDECGGDLNEAATWLASNAPAKAELDAVNADEGSNLMALQIGSILVGLCLRAIVCLISVVQTMSACYRLFDLYCSVYEACVWHWYANLV